jgi:hypothetical protein
MRATRFLFVGALTVALAGAAPGATLVGPTPYLSQADSPFVPAGTFHREDFEDNALSTPGVTPSTGSVVPPGGITDSVDADDGAIDGSGTAGHSFFASPGSTGIRFTFDAGVLGSFPTAAGIVWTDGEGAVTFEAFDSVGGSLGTVGPVTIGDGAVTGETAEDRFFGVFEAGGISAIFISNAAGGIEVDHLQYGSATLSSSTTTTTVVGGSTTTTTLPPGCANVPTGPTFESLNCRLATLIAQVAASTELGGPRQSRISKNLAKAKLRKEGAEAKCAESKTLGVKGQLGKAVLRVVGTRKTLSSPAARSTIPSPLREGLVAALSDLQVDLRTLRRNVRCPDDVTT